MAKDAHLRMPMLAGSAPVSRRDWRGLLATLAAITAAAAPVAGDTYE
jgi:hypothetical protein